MRFQAWVTDTAGGGTVSGVERQATTVLPTRAGTFQAIGFVDPLAGTEHVALVHGKLPADGALIRVHSECLTGDAFGSLRCDCGPQLDASLGLITAEGAGAVVYLRGHEGRGIGLIAKLRAYALQDVGLDTVDANLAQGLPADARTYGVAAAILADLGVRSVRLLTNNPAKVVGLRAGGVAVLERVPLELPPTRENVEYLQTKADRMGHRLTTLPARV